MERGLHVDGPPGDHLQKEWSMTTFFQLQPELLGLYQAVSNWLVTTVRPIFCLFRLSSDKSPRSFVLRDDVANEA